MDEQELDKRGLSLLGNSTLLFNWFFAEALGTIIL